MKPLAPPAQRICLIGGGNMAGALIGGLGANPQSDTTAIVVAGVVETSAQRRSELSAQFAAPALPVFGSLGEAEQAGALAVDAVVLAVKPQQLRAVAQALAPHIGQATVVSIAAGIRTTDLSRWLSGYARIVRAMPNTPALVGAGMTGLFSGPATTPADRDLAQRIMAAVGETLWVSVERDLDTVTALSGSGPAYVFYWMEAMIAAGTRLGLPPATAQELTIATFRGAAKLAAESTESPARLREQVTSPGGTTAAALSMQANHGVAAGIEAAVEAAFQRAGELGDQASVD